MRQAHASPTPWLIFAAQASDAIFARGYNKIMHFCARNSSLKTRRCASVSLLAVAVVLAACKPAQKPEDEASQVALWLTSVPELKPLNVSNAEFAQLSKAHEAGLSDPSSVTLIKLARARQKPFTDGQSIADLLNAGSSEQTVIELARLNQLGLWAGEASAMRLAGLSDKIILAVAKRRSQNLPVLSGGKLAELKNAGASDAVILDMVEKGVSEASASGYIAQRQRAAGGHGFVYQGRHRKS